MKPTMKVGIARFATASFGQILSIGLMKLTRKAGIFRAYARNSRVS
jgi:hypothetical protein